MIKTNDLIDWIESLVPYTYFMNDFPATAPNTCAFVRITPGDPLSEWVPIPRPDFQIVVRAAQYEDEQAEDVANNLIKTLHKYSGGYLSGYKLILCRAEQSAPFYIGKDDNSRPLYSINFALTLL